MLSIVSLIINAAGAGMVIAAGCLSIEAKAVTPLADVFMIAGTVYTVIGVIGLLVAEPEVWRC